MYDIVICSLSAKYVHASLAPWCLYSSIKDNLPSCSVFVYENTINADRDKIVNDILSTSGKIYAFSCYIWNITAVLSIAENIKGVNPDATILLGGPEVSYNADHLLSKYSFVDFIISGEGEIPIVRFLNEYFGDRCYRNVPGLCFAGHISAPYICDEEPASPYSEEYLSSLCGRISYIESTRGCPYSCAFCLSGRCGGVRYFSLNRIFNEISLLANSGTKTVKFVDRTFNANTERANKILTYIIENSGKNFSSDVCFHFEIAGDILRESTFEILKSAPKGLFQLEIGLQTFNEDTLKYINRKTNTDVLIKNIKRLLSFENMHIHIDLIAGLPLEDLNSFHKTFNTAYSLHADMLQLGFLKLLHGAPMREQSDKYPCSFSIEPPYEVCSTPWLTAEEINNIHKCEDALEKLYNSGRFLEVLDFLIKTQKLDAFEFFCEFGMYVSEFEKNLSLNEYSEIFYNWILQKYNTDKYILRDLFVKDRLSSNASGKLPAFLKENNPMYKKIKKHCIDNGILAGFAILSSESKVVFQDKKSPVAMNGRFGLIFKELSEFEDI